MLHTVTYNIMFYNVLKLYSRNTAIAWLLTTEMRISLFAQFNPLPTNACTA